MIDCPTCSGTGKIEATPIDGDFLPELAEALRVARTGDSTPGSKTARCTTCIVIAHAVPGEAREALISAAAGRISGRALHLSLRRIGINISRESITTHRNEAHQP